MRGEWHCIFESNARFINGVLGGGLDNVEWDGE